MLKKILAPIDGTEYSWRSLEYAANLAKITRGSLVVFTVVKPGIKAIGGAPLEEELAYSANNPVMQVGNEVLGAAKLILDRQDVACDYLLSVGDYVAEEILKAAKREMCDTIVIGSRGFGTIEGLLKNSVSRIIVEEANLPVVVVK